MNKKLFVTLFVGCLAAGELSAQKAMAWNTPDFNQQNREQRRDNFFAFENEALADSLMHLSGRTVELHYKEYLGALPWRGQQKYIVDRIVSVE